MLKLINGDYVSDGRGGLCRACGQEALLQQVLFRLTARRGTFPFLPEMGSRFWQLGRVPAGERQSAAAQYVAEALRQERGVSVERVTLDTRDGGILEVTAELRYQGEPLSAVVRVR